MIITIITIVKMMIIITTITIVNVMMIITTTRDQSRPGNMSSYLTSSWKPAGPTAARLIIIVMTMMGIGMGTGTGTV